VTKSPPNGRAVYYVPVPLSTEMYTLPHKNGVVFATPSSRNAIKSPRLDLP